MERMNSFTEQRPDHAETFIVVLCLYCPADVISNDELNSKRKELDYLLNLPAKTDKNKNVDVIENKWVKKEEKGRERLAVKPKNTANKSTDYWQNVAKLFESTIFISVVIGISICVIISCILHLLLCKLLIQRRREAGSSIEKGPQKVKERSNSLLRKEERWPYNQGFRDNVEEPLFQKTQQRAKKVKSDENFAERKAIRNFGHDKLVKNNENEVNRCPVERNISQVDENSKSVTSHLKVELSNSRQITRYQIDELKRDPTKTKVPASKNLTSAPGQMSVTPQSPNSSVALIVKDKCSTGSLFASSERSKKVNEYLSNHIRPAARKLSETPVKCKNKTSKGNLSSSERPAKFQERPSNQIRLVQRKSPDSAVKDKGQTSKGSLSSPGRRRTVHEYPPDQIRLTERKSRSLASPERRKIAHETGPQLNHVQKAEPAVVMGTKLKSVSSNKNRQKINTDPIDLLHEIKTNRTLNPVKNRILPQTVNHETLLVENIKSPKLKRANQRILPEVKQQEKVTDMLKGIKLKSTAQKHSDTQNISQSTKPVSNANKNIPVPPTTIGGEHGEKYPTAVTKNFGKDYHWQRNEHPPPKKSLLLKSIREATDGD